MTYEELIEASKLDDPLIIDGQVYDVTEDGLYIHGVDENGDYCDDLLIRIRHDGFELSTRGPGNRDDEWTYWGVFSTLDILVGFIYTL
jgi:hypothetical protein